MTVASCGPEDPVYVVVIIWARAGTCHLPESLSIFLADSTGRWWIVRVLGQVMHMQIWQESNVMLHVRVIFTFGKRCLRIGRDTEHANHTADKHGAETENHCSEECS